MKVSIIIPIIKEPYINKLIERIHSTLKKNDHEIIVVELVLEGEEPSKIKNAKYVRQQSKGLGRALLEGLQFAKGDTIVLMDGDGSHRPEDIPRMLDRMKDYDVVIGSRFVEGGKTKDETHRKIISFVFRNLASYVLGLGIKDSMSGFSCVKREVYDNLNLDPIGFKINMELVFKAKKKGYRVCEVPIYFEQRKEGVTTTSSFNRWEAFKIIKFILELRLGLR